MITKSNNENTIITYDYPSEEEKKLIEVNETRNRLQVLKYIINELIKLGYYPDYYKVLKILFFADEIHLYKYDELIVPDRYVKMDYGPVPSYCYDIFNLLTGNDLFNSYVDKPKYKELVKEEIKYLGDYKVESITPIDSEYLSDSHKECLDQSIKEYKDKSFNELLDISHRDEIYNSVPNIKDEITIFDMARSLDKEIKDEEGKFEKHIREIYYEY